jgi:hypothetical protein
VVLICISFMARDGEHFFMCFWPFGFLLFFMVVLGFEHRASHLLGKHSTT